MNILQELGTFWQRQSFRRLQSDIGILWMREDAGETALVAIIPERLPGQPEIPIDQIESGLAGIEQKLMIRSMKRVNRLTLMLCSDLPADDRIRETKDYPDIWWMDWKHGEILIYEWQKTDFLGLRNSLEDFLVTFQTKDRQENRMEIRRMLQPVTLTIVSVNILVHLILSLLGNTEDSYFMAGHGAMTWDAVVQQKEYYRLFTSMFLHFGIQHLLQNMLVLMLVGARLERILGKKNYLLIYLSSGLIAALSSMYFTLRGTQDIAAGASGAIFGLMGALVCLILKDSIGRSRRYIRDIGLAGVIFMVACAASYGFFEVGVDNAAHIGGLLGGIVLTGLLLAVRRKTE